MTAESQRIDGNFAVALTHGSFPENRQLWEEIRWLLGLYRGLLSRFGSGRQTESGIDLGTFCISQGDVKNLLDGLEQEYGDSNLTGTAERDASLHPLNLLPEPIADSLTPELRARNPLRRARTFFQLSAFEYAALLVCLLPEIEPKLKRLAAFFQNDVNKTQVSRDLLLDLLCRSLEDRLVGLALLNPEATLFRFGLVHASRPWESYEAEDLRFLPSRVLLAALANPDSHNAAALPGVKTYPLEEDSESRLEEALAKPLACAAGKALAGLEKGLHSPVFCITVQDASLFRWAGGVVSRELGSPLTFADAGRVKPLLKDLILQCVLAFRPLALWVPEDDASKEFWEEWEETCRMIAGFNWFVLMGSPRPFPDTLADRFGFWEFEVPALGYQAQLRYLKDCVASHRVPFPLAPGEMAMLAERFSLPAGLIRSALARARNSALARNPENPAVTFEDCLREFRAVSQPKLSSYARKINPIFGWEDLVLPADRKRQLFELTQHVHHHRAVMEEMGFQAKMSLGKGKSVLFAGPSGTGKTMAAEVLANELRVDLFKIDLAAVVSKYIGETEKNLSRIFDEARRSQSILFFDEAEALLGKRSEVKDAHDRYANIEIAYLLQKMEEYEGITILATNLRQNIDDAFVRRLRFIVEFPFPEEASRAQIWKRIWPEQAPLDSEVDLAYLARQFELSGGNIRNVALAAAFLARAEGSPIGMGHLLRAVRREMQKLGRICMPEDFGRFAGLVKEAA